MDQVVQDAGCETLWWGVDPGYQPLEPSTVPPDHSPPSQPDTGSYLRDDGIWESLSPCRQFLRRFAVDWEVGDQSGNPLQCGTRVIEVGNGRSFPAGKSLRILLWAQVEQDETNLSISYVMFGHQYFSFSTSHVLHVPGWPDAGTIFIADLSQIMQLLFLNCSGWGLMSFLKKPRNKKNRILFEGLMVHELWTKR